MATATHALSPAPPIQRPRVLMIGTAFITAAVAMVFAGLIGAYLSQRGAAVADGGTWLPDDISIPLTQPNIMMMGLLMGCVTVQWAVYAIARDDRLNTYLALGTTLVLGLMTIVTQAYLYTLMGADISANSQSVLLYAITGGHVAFLVGTMIFLALMAFRALGGQFTSRQHDGISAAALTWHVMVAVFFVIWLAVYITK